jgi:hypothetical protein
MLCLYIVDGRYMYILLHMPEDACIIIIAASESVSPTPHTGLEQIMSSADENVLDQNE